MESTISRFYTAVTDLLNGNAEPIIRQWATDQRVSLLISSGEREVGIDAVSQFFREMAAALGNNPFKTRVEPADPGFTVVGDLALVDLIEKVHPDTTPAVDIVNRATIVFRRIDGDWKVIHYHNDFINPMMLAFSHMVRHHATAVR